ncbi:hypothetical protein KIH39_25875 [Telmatocola sphagniphila]|uniref:Uncharacterized protein n=1 Tax=Telmatocola sphagniphila TaxID=1123043 RepID=A0A8E6B7Z7_9BACT|nr:hypothetical protein [Telmatocola sphagniphila]QVL32223.1 hypothetical protein KIH39_25875 [Telmatocola sphagniphila]
MNYLELAQSLIKKGDELIERCDKLLSDEFESFSNDFGSEFKELADQAKADNHTAFQCMESEDWRIQRLGLICLS